MVAAFAARFVRSRLLQAPLFSRVLPYVQASGTNYGYCVDFVHGQSRETNVAFVAARPDMKDVALTGTFFFFIFW